MELCICDRCGKKIDTLNDRLGVSVAAIGVSFRYLDPDRAPCYDKEYDLCDDCMEGLKEYMKGETNGGTKTNL